MKQYNLSQGSPLKNDSSLLLVILVVILVILILSQIVFGFGNRNQWSIFNQRHLATVEVLDNSYDVSNPAKLEVLDSGYDVRYDPQTGQSSIYKKGDQVNIMPEETVSDQIQKQSARLPVSTSLISSESNYSSTTQVVPTLIIMDSISQQAIVTSTSSAVQPTTTPHTLPTAYSQLNIIATSIPVQAIYGTSWPQSEVEDYNFCSTVAGNVLSLDGRTFTHTKPDGSIFIETPQSFFNTNHIKMNLIGAVGIKLEEPEIKIAWPKMESVLTPQEISFIESVIEEGVKVYGVNYDDPIMKFLIMVTLYYGMYSKSCESMQSITVRLMNVEHETGLSIY